MPKNNNLQDYLKDLYEGIKSRKPDASKNPQDFRREIENLAKTDDADALAADIRLGKTAYVDNQKITGTIEDYNGEMLINGLSFDATQPFLFRIEEIHSDSNTSAEIKLDFKSVTFAPIKYEDYVAATAPTYIYRFYFYIPDERIVSFRGYKDKGNDLDGCIWAAGKINTIIPTTISSVYINNWTNDEINCLQNAVEFKPGTVQQIASYQLTPGYYFVDVRLSDLYNSGDPYAYIGISL